MPDEQAKAKTAAKMKATARARRWGIMQIGARRLAIRDGRVRSIFDEPDKEIMSAAECVEALRLDVIHGANDASAYDALMRLVDRGLLESIIYSGRGGGKRMFARSAVQKLVEKLSGVN